MKLLAHVFWPFNLSCRVLSIQLHLLKECMQFNVKIKMIYGCKNPNKKTSRVSIAYNQCRFSHIFLCFALLCFSLAVAHLQSTNMRHFITLNMYSLLLVYTLNLIYILFCNINSFNKHSYQAVE